MAEKIERVYTVPLRAAYETVRGKRGKRAVNILRAFLARHLKVEEGEVWISGGINSAIFARGIKKPPRKIKIKAIKEDGKVKAMLIDEKIEEKEEKKAEVKKEEKPKEEAKKETEEERKAREKLEKIAEKAERMG